VAVCALVICARAKAAINIAAMVRELWVVFMVLVGLRLRHSFAVYRDDAYSRAGNASAGSRTV
jgi:hypothetical protein